MKKHGTYRLKTISDYHSLVNIKKPMNDFFSIVRFEDFTKTKDYKLQNLIFDYYVIALKKNFKGRMIYGQKDYNLDNGIMVFMSPNQELFVNTDIDSNHSGWLIMIHPDFLLNTNLLNKIKKYDYFDYSVNEALFLTDNEESVIRSIMENINNEYYSKDNFSHDLIITQLELILIYAERFYNRQFDNHKTSINKLTYNLEILLTEYFENKVIENGLPTVQFIADKLNFSPNYLCSLLKLLTGYSTQQHIHNKLIEKAKEKLSLTNKSISEISYDLGFEHSQSFSKLFKNKTNLSPLDFRRSFQLQNTNK